MADTEAFEEREMKSEKKWWMAALAMLVVMGAAAVVGAHPGHHHHGGEGMGLMAGLVHPWSGIDHLAAAVLVGAWAVMGSAERGRIVLPGVFLGAMTLGVVAMALGVGPAFAGGLTAASVVVLGALVGARWSVPMVVAVGAMALFGMIHGASHLAAGAGLSLATGLYVLGLVASTALLHAIGVAAATWAMRSKRSMMVARLAGGVAAVGGAVWLLSGWPIL